MRPQLISPEFRLVVECCRRAFSSGNDRNLRSLSATVDWPRFVALVRFHRVQGLVWSSLHSAGAEIPPEALSALAADAQDIAITNLRIAAEAGELRREFEAAGLRLLFVKGLTVGALAYSKPMLKMGWDIDMLIAEAEVIPAAELLTARGYHRAVPAAAVDLAAWHARRKESVWSRPDQRLHVELHSRLADNRRLIPGIGIGSPARNVQVADGIALPTLAADELFAYLCVHGASSLWFRLKWITDLAALLSTCPPAEIERLYRRARELGAGRAADQALLLADEVFGTLDGSGLGDRIGRDRISCRLARAALKQLTGNPHGREPTEVRLGTLAIHWTQLLLLPGMRFAVGEAARQVRDALA